MESAFSTHQTPSVTTLTQIAGNGIIEHVSVRPVNADTGIIRNFVAAKNLQINARNMIGILEIVYLVRMLMRKLVGMVNVGRF